MSQFKFGYKKNINSVYYLTNKQVFGRFLTYLCFYDMWFNQLVNHCMVNVNTLMRKKKQCVTIKMYLFHHQRHVPAILKKKKITFTDFFLIVNFVLLLITIMPLGDRSKLTDE